MSTAPENPASEPQAPLRRLILLRHAHAENDSPGGRDFDRALSELGRTQCQQASAWLQSHGLKPSKVLCSPARRAEQTLTLVSDALDGPSIQFDPRIYEATPGDLLRLIEPHLDGECLLLVGHNPGLEGLVALLASGRLGGHRGMPTASIACLSLRQGAPVEPNAGALDAVWWP